MSNQNKNIRTSYSYYKKKVKNPVDIKVYLDINNNYNKFLIEKVLDGHRVTLPSRLGTLEIIGREQKVRFDENGKVIGLAPDWVKTKQLWDRSEEARKNKKLVYHTNLHSNNIRYKYFWSKFNVLVENKTLYSLKMTRTNKRAVHKLILQNKQYKTK